MILGSISAFSRSKVKKNDILTQPRKEYPDIIAIENFLNMIETCSFFY